jgi:hypothetical protein
VIRDFLKSLRSAILAGRAEFHRAMWRARRRREIQDPFGEQQ